MAGLASLGLGGGDVTVSRTSRATAVSIALLASSRLVGRDVTVSGAGWAAAVSMAGLASSWIACPRLRVGIMLVMMMWVESSAFPT